MPRQRAVAKRTSSAFRYLFAMNPLPMWVYDLETLGFLEVNAAALVQYGYSREAFLAMRITDIRPPEDIPRLLANVARPRSDLQVSGEWRHRRGDGQIIDVRITSHTLEFAGRQAALVVAQDISEQKRAERALRALNEELEHRVRQRTVQLEAANQELEAFAYTAAHDLRSPLITIGGFSQMLLEDYAAAVPDEVRQRLRQMAEIARRMGVLIEELLTFSRLSRRPVVEQRVDPADVARQALAELNGARPEHRPGSVRIGTLPACRADPTLLKQVFVNLLSNALKFSRRRTDAVIEIGWGPAAEDPAHWMYFVKDNGAGFDMQDADKLFGVFQRLHSTDDYEGTGVGLAIVQRIIRRHGGRIWAEGEVEKGATFYFTLPKSPPA